MRNSVAISATIVIFVVGLSSAPAGRKDRSEPKLTVMGGGTVEFQVPGSWKRVRHSPEEDGYEEMLFEIAKVKSPQGKLVVGALVVTMKVPEDTTLSGLPSAEESCPLGDCPVLKDETGPGPWRTVLARADTLPPALVLQRLGLQNGVAVNLIVMVPVSDEEENRPEFVDMFNDVAATLRFIGAAAEGSN